MHYRFNLALLVALTLAPAAHAATPLTIDPIVVTATRTPQPISNLLSDVRIIDTDTLAAAGNITLVEILQMHGGVEIIANGGAGQTTGVFMRGTNTNHIVLLVDGIRINSATSGTNAFEHIPVSQIERIEILRGPASSQYGADAIGGVIQIFTKSGKSGPQFLATAGAGSYNTQLIGAGFNQQWGNTSLNVQAGYQSTDAFSATNSSSSFFNPDDDAYRNKNINIKFSHRFNDNHQLTLGTWTSQGVSHFDGSSTTDDVNHQRISASFIESRNQLLKNWLSNIKLARGTDKNISTGAFPGLFRTDQDQLIWQNDFTAPGGKITAGWEYRREQVESDTAYSQTERIIRSAFLGYTGSVGNHLLQLSGRRDDNNQFGIQTTGTAAYGYRITPTVRLAISSATAFKAPSFNDLYYPLAFGFSGNPNLKPEQARNREGGIYYDNKGTHGKFIVFENRIRDLITMDPGFTTLINVSEAKIRGATASYSALWRTYQLSAELTHQQPKDTDTGNLLPRRARNYASGSITQNWDNWEVGGELVTAGERFDRIPNTEAKRMGGYTVVNLTTQYRASAELTLRARWNNILDKRYELAQTFNTPGSNVFFSAEYAFK